MSVRLSHICKGERERGEKGHLPLSSFLSVRRQKNVGVGGCVRKYSNRSNNCLPRGGERRRKSNLSPRLRRRIVHAKGGGGEESLIGLFFKGEEGVTADWEKGNRGGGGGEGA